MSKIPANFLCPLTKELMLDPVFAEDGHSYEREALEKWFQSENCSPQDPDHKVVDKKITPNMNLKNTIREHLKEKPQCLHQHLFNIVNRNDLKALQKIMGLGATLTLTFTNEQGNTLLHDAAEAGSDEVLLYLLEHLNVNTKNSIHGHTALSVAAQFGKLGTAKNLLEKGATIDVPNNYCESPLHIAAWYGQSQLVQFLLENGAGVNLKTSEGSTPLHLASIYGHASATSILLGNGAEIDYQGEDDGNTALHCAARHGKIDVVNVLVESNADLEKKK